MSVCSAYCDGCTFRKKFTAWDLLYCDYLFMSGERRPCPAGDGCTVRVKRRVYRRKERTPEEREAFMEEQRKKRKERDHQRYLNMTEEQRERNREKSRGYYAAHKSEMAAKHSAWYQSNKARAAAYQRERRRKLKEKAV